MTDEPNLVSEFLRARREFVEPEQADIPRLGPRRLAASRRDDLPLRPRRPRRRDVETVPSGIANLVAAVPLPAFVEGRYLDVLAANSLATALSPRLAVGGNRLRDIFLDPAERDLHPDWEAVATSVVASFRRLVGTDTDDPRFIELAGELSLASALFGQLWARPDAVAEPHGVVEFEHPVVGRLRLNREELLVSGAEHLVLVILHPDAGSDAAGRLALLASSALEPSSLAQRLASAAD
ncbi:MmyB family transcriptional regulator [Schumannella luteola]|jgi:hypothetical protein